MQLNSKNWKCSQNYPKSQFYAPHLKVLSSKLHYFCDSSSELWSARVFWWKKCIKMQLKRKNWKLPQNYLKYQFYAPHPTVKASKSHYFCVLSSELWGAGVFWWEKCIKMQLNSKNWKCTQNYPKSQFYAPHPTVLDYYYYYNGRSAPRPVRSFVLTVLASKLHYFCDSSSELWCRGVLVGKVHQNAVKIENLKISPKLPKSQFYAPHPTVLASKLHYFCDSSSKLWGARVFWWEKCIKMQLNSKNWKCSQNYPQISVLRPAPHSSVFQITLFLRF